MNGIMPQQGRFCLGRLNHIFYKIHKSGKWGRFRFPTLISTQKEAGKMTDYHYWLDVIKKILIFTISVLLIYIGFKISIFYIPFLIAFILATYFCNHLINNNRIDSLDNLNTSFRSN